MEPLGEGPDEAEGELDPTYWCSPSEWAAMPAEAKAFLTRESARERMKRRHRRRKERARQQSSDAPPLGQ